jgi:hypothetical protein
LLSLVKNASDGGGSVGLKVARGAERSHPSGVRGFESHPPHP